jgi:cytochrome P450
MIDITSEFGDGLHAVLRAAAADGPVAIDAVTGSTVVLRHAEVEQLAHDRRVAGVGLALFDFMGIEDGPLREWYGALMFTTEGETHQRLRSLVSRAFTPRAVEGLRADAASMAIDALSPIAANGEGDLVAALNSLPMRVMCRLLGVPDADVAVFGGWADALSPVFSFMEPEQITAATDALAALLDYVGDLAKLRRDEPGDDLITALLTAQDQGDRLDRDELVAMVANLIVGGHDTTASQLGCSLLTILRHPKEADKVRAEPDLIGSAVAETIRYDPSIPMVPRTCAESITVAGSEVPAGALILLCTASANREPSVWRDPETVDVARVTQSNAPRLLSFGAGPHYCLGAALARLTVEEAVRAYLTLENPRLVEDPMPWRSVLGRAPQRLLVSVG